MANPKWSGSARKLNIEKVLQDKLNDVPNVEIAKKYGVTREAVSKLLAKPSVRRRIERRQIMKDEQLGKEAAIIVARDAVNKKFAENAPKIADRVVQTALSKSSNLQQKASEFVLEHTLPYTDEKKVSIFMNAQTVKIWQAVFGKDVRNATRIDRIGVDGRKEAEDSQDDSSESL